MQCRPFTGNSALQGLSLPQLSGRFQAMRESGGSERGIFT